MTPIEGFGLNLGILYGFHVLYCHEYDDARWIAFFRMTKASVFRLFDLLHPHNQRQNIRYRYAMPPLIRVACTLLKLA